MYKTKFVNEYLRFKSRPFHSVRFVSTETNKGFNCEFVFSRCLEFLLGENILVAPVIRENAKSRDVYLPAGLWRDENHPESSLITGRTWLRNYPADLEVLPWFTKVGEAPKTSDSIRSTSSAVCVVATALCVFMCR